jgi:hypothetical protein
LRSIEPAQSRRSPARARTFNSVVHRARITARDYLPRVFLAFGGAMRMIAFITDA